jgi:tRNA(Arg) A34 adenosine deaminase TadA
MTTVTPEQEWLDEAVRLATASVATGGGPFGAVVVRAGTVVATGTNAVTKDLDPTAHAEVTAIRAACRALGTFDLSGCLLVASCEPCPMCAAASPWARLDRVIYAADRDMAAAAGFDDRAFYELFDTPRAGWPMQVVQADRSPEALARADTPFVAWRAHTGRTDY